MSKQFYIKQFSLAKPRCLNVSTVRLSKTFLAIKFSQTVLIQAIQFSTQLVLFNPLIGPYQVLPFRARVDLGAIAMKWCSAFPKATASLERHHQIV